jgi:uncharacterized protein
MIYTISNDKNDRFEWDPDKAASNLKKHGVSFKQATSAFYDPSALYRLDEKHSTNFEQREMCLGLTDRGILVVVFTEREQGSRLRIISARRANRKEWNRYHENTL